MESPISWSDNYSIGIDEIDEQHKYLFGLINNIRQCDDIDKLKEHLVAIFKYTRVHFANEEQLMRDIDYPQYEKHKEIHGSLLMTLTDMSNEAVKDPSKKARFDKFLSTWLISHISYQDNHIGEYMRNSDISIDLG